MHALIIVSHPLPGSLTHSVAAEIAQGVTEGGNGDTVEIGDLSAEGFDPRFNGGDAGVHRRTAEPAADVLAEQARIDRADALVLVYPIYWWSMPGLLKGWIDRVFTNGWAYEETPTGVGKLLRGRRVHLVGIAAADAGTWERHGYFRAVRTQIDHGVFDYCGASVVRSELLLESDSQDPAVHLAAGRALGRAVFGQSMGQAVA